MDEDIAQVPMFSRGQKGRAEDVPIEVRLQAKPSVIAMVDARCFLEDGKSRTLKINEILYAWAKKQEYEATVLLRALRGNASLLDANGSDWTPPESVGNEPA